MLAGLCLTASAEAAPPLERLASVEQVKSLLAPGKPRVVHFWATWCEPCLVELPQQLALGREASAQGIDVVFVNLDGYDREGAVVERLKSLGGLDVGHSYLLDLGLDAQAISKMFDPAWNGGLPATFGFSARGARVASFRRALKPEDAAHLLHTVCPGCTTHPEAP